MKHALDACLQVLNEHQNGEVPLGVDRPDVMDVAQVPADVALYYPFVHFMDEGWLKLAALYWPRITRIVPPDYETSDSYTVKRLADELDLIRNVSPVPASRTVGPLFLQFIAEHEAGLRGRFGVDLANEWAPDPVTVQRMGLGHGTQSLTAGLAHIYSSKFNPTLLAQLIESGLAAQVRGQQWIGVHPALGSVYMAALAGEVARRNNLEPLTDDTTNHLATSGWSMDRLALALLGDPGLDEPVRSEDQVSTALAFVAFQSVIPKGPLQVDQVIEIRRRYEADRGTFAAHMRTLATDIRQVEGVDDPQAFAANLGAIFDRTLGREFARLERAIKDAGIDTAFSAMNMRIEVPLTLVTSASVAGVTLNPLLALGGAVAFALARLNQSHRRQIRRLVAESPAGYLLRLEESLEPLSLMGRIGQSFSLFSRGLPEP